MIWGTEAGEGPGVNEAGPARRHEVRAGGRCLGLPHLPALLELSIMADFIRLCLRAAGRKEGSGRALRSRRRPS